MKSTEHFAFFVSERHKTSAPGLRTDQMETSQSVAEDHDKVDGISDENGAVAEFAEEDRGKFWHGGRRILCVSSLADDPQSSHLLHHFCVHHSTADGADRAKRFSL